MASLSPAELPEPPALMPPEGLHSDFSTRYMGLQQVTVAILSLYLLLSTIVIAARLIAKAWGTRRLEVEDLVTFLAWAGFVAYTALGLYGVSQGLGRHQWNVKRSRMPYLAKLINASGITFCAVVYTARLGLLLQYMRIFVPSKQGLIYGAIHFLIWSNLAVYTFVFFWLIFACGPREKIWKPSTPGRCLNPNAVSIFSASWSLLSDLSILVLPIYSIWRLQMPIKRKAGVSAVFAVGLIGCCASIARMVFGVRLLHAPDQCFVGQQNNLLSNTEITMILVCSNLPLLPKFFQLVRHGCKGPSTYVKQREGGYPRQRVGLASRSDPRPWDKSADSITRLASSFIPREIELTHGISNTAYADYGVGTERDLGNGSHCEEYPHHGEILKTVEMESTTTVV